VPPRLLDCGIGWVGIASSDDGSPSSLASAVSGSLRRQPHPTSHDARAAFAIYTYRFDSDVDAELHRIELSVNVTTMRDVDDPHDNSIVEDLVDHPKFTASG
jgi:hypothetical protein